MFASHPDASKRNWGTCVDFPHPVSPATNTTSCRATKSTTLLRASQAGNLRLAVTMEAGALTHSGARLLYSMTCVARTPSRHCLCRSTGRVDSRVIMKTTSTRSETASGSSSLFTPSQHRGPTRRGAARARRGRSPRSCRSRRFLWTRSSRWRRGASSSPR